MFVPNKYFSLVYYLLVWTKDYLSGENATACGPTLSLLANITLDLKYLAGSNNIL